MAVEDGAVIGLLLTKLQDMGISNKQGEKNQQLSEVFRIYESMRKRRTETNVVGAVHTRHFYNLADGDEQLSRDAELRNMPSSNWNGSCSFNWADAAYQKDLLGFDVLADAEEQFERQKPAFQMREPRSNL